MEPGEPLTPAGRLLLRPEINQIIHTADVAASPMLQLPRFSSLLVHDSDGREHWRRVKVDLDRHVIIHRDRLVDDPAVSDEDVVNDFMADLAVSMSLSTDKPLWELHLFVPHKCGVLRGHHALGDGTSLTSAILLTFRRADDPTRYPTVKGLGTSSSSAPAAARRRRNDCCGVLWCALRKAVIMVLYTLLHVMEFCLTVLWLKDRRTGVSGGAGVELWPRKLAMAKFKLDDMKLVKRAVVGAILEAKDIIPEPNLLAKCLEDALLEMKDFAVTNDFRASSSSLTVGKAVLQYL